jgi:FkbM family methyltransferase
MIVVQIGTNLGSWEIYPDGTAGPVINEEGHVQNDSCFDFIKKNIDIVESLHLIEPLIECFPHIEKSYSFFSKKKIHNIAITNNKAQKNLEIFRPKNNKVSGHSSFNINHFNHLNPNEIESIKVDSLTLEDFLNVNLITKCDRLYIDTEGLDSLILLEYDYDKYSTNYIEFEVAHSDGPNTKSTNYQKLIDRLKKDGFTIQESPYDSLNLIALR